LVIGIAGHGDDLVRIGRLALKSVAYYEIVTTLALILGLIAVNIVKPGAGFSASGLNPPDTNFTTITWVTQMEAIVPTSFFLAMSDHNAVIAVVFCAIMFSVAISLADERSRNFMLDFNASLSGIMFKVVQLVMNYAPIGVGCAIASTVGEYGLESLAAAGKLIGTLYVTLLLFILIILLPIILFCRFPVVEFARALSEPFLMAFATSSSESALPKAMNNMVAFGVPSDIAAFVIPTGYSFNLEGSTLYLAIAVIFCAQVAGINKTVGDQVVICLSLMLTTKGVAAVPRASYIVLASTLTAFHIPIESLAVAMTVEPFMDMARTAVNVMGNMVASAVIAKWEGEFRNEDWRARRSRQMPETLAMDDTEGDERVGELPQHRGHLATDHGHAMNDPPLQQQQQQQQRPPLHTNTLYSEKASIHSLQSVHSTNAPNAGPSNQRQHGSMGFP
jgi:proton glutamate symport protein